MLTASHILSHTHNPADTITLDETARHRRRIKLMSDNGIAFLLDLPAARLLLHGEAKNPHHLLQLSWQLGNRHLPTQILHDHLRIRQDHVIHEMLLGLGGEVTEVIASFNPEGGAYGNQHSHEHQSQGHHHD